MNEQTPDDAKRTQKTVPSTCFRHYFFWRGGGGITSSAQSQVCCFFVVSSGDGGTWLAERKVLVKPDTVGLLLACVRAGTAVLSQAEVVAVDDTWRIEIVGA